jgi:hypothetical protein
MSCYQLLKRKVAVTSTRSASNAVTCTTMTSIKQASLRAAAYINVNLEPDNYLGLGRRYL